MDKLEGDQDKKLYKGNEKNNDIEYTVDDGFRVLESRLNILLSDRAAISSRQAEIEKYLSQYITKYVGVLSGGYTRTTMIAPLKENAIDLHILFNQEHAVRLSPLDLLEKLHVTLRAEYPEVVKNIQGKSILLGFPELTFNVIPGFIIDHERYLVPERASVVLPNQSPELSLSLTPGDNWAEMDYSIPQQLIDDADRQHAGYLRPVIKMMKCWNRSHDDLFDPYFLELLVTDLLSDVKISSYAQAVTHVFKKGKGNVVFRIQDPAQNGAMIDGLTNVKALVDGMLRIQDAYTTCIDAGNFEAQGHLNHAYIEWGNLFPGYFPTPMEMVVQLIEDSGITGARALEIMRDRLS